MNDIHFFWHSFLFSYSFFLAKPLYVTRIDVDGNIYFGFDADVFIDIKVFVAVVWCCLLIMLQHSMPSSYVSLIVLRSKIDCDKIVFV